MKRRGFAGLLLAAPLASLAHALRDWPAIAIHARGSGDPRAAEWTRRAVAELRPKIQAAGHL